MDAHDPFLDTYRELAAAQGFPLVGISPAARPETLPHLHRWLEQGLHGEMGYMQRRQEAYADPARVLIGVKSVIMLGATYTPPRPAKPGTPLIAAYAQGPADYHDVLRQQAEPLATALHQRIPGCRTRIAIDTAPLLERDFARQAGLGWFGKNTMLINKELGSYFLLVALLTDAELPPDPPHEAQHCGSCTRCLDICPTDALREPHVLDARRCLSYFTIELHDQLAPRELRSEIGDWIFGCDLCQIACPWNRHAPSASVDQLRAQDWPETIEAWLDLSDQEWSELLRETPLTRPGIAGLRRNLVVAMGNQRNLQHLQRLGNLLNDPDPQVRAATVWALAQLPGAQTRPLLEARQAVEVDPIVRVELNCAINESLDEHATSQPREGGF